MINEVCKSIANKEVLKDNSDYFFQGGCGCCPAVEIPARATRTGLSAATPRPGNRFG